MKKSTPRNFGKKASNVKEISDGVYINLNRITSDENEFEKAIQESFEKLKEDDLSNNSKDKPKESK